MQFQYNDGGRAEAGFNGKTGDCVVRAIAIASGRPYRTIYDDINTMRLAGERGKRKSNARTGVYTSKAWFKRYMVELGFEWVSCMSIGSGCTTHLIADELPSGRIVVSLSRHYAAVIDGVLYDTYDHSEKRVEIGAINGEPYRKEWYRCVYGYWRYGK